MEISCIVSPQKPESIFCSLRHNSLRVSNENSERLFPDRHSTVFRCENFHIRGNLFAIGMNKIQNYWNFKHEMENMREKPGKCFKCFSSCHNSSPERIFSSFLFFFISWGSSQKAKQLKLFFSFMDFSIPLNVLSKLFQFLFSGIIFLHSPQEFWQTFFLLLLFFFVESFYREMKEKKMF